MRPAVLAMSAAASLGLVAAEPDRVALEAVLARAGERVAQFFARAQSLVFLETVRLMPLSPTWSSDGPTRTVESELRVSWEPDEHGQPPAEAQVVRHLLRVNGHPPRANDWHNCTAPEQQTAEPQPLSLLLPAKRNDYAFTLAGRGRVDRREAIMVDYRLLAPVRAASRMVEGRDDCVRYDFEGGLRGRIWIDEETYEVLRLDQSLIGMIDIPLPREATRRPDSPTRFTLERWDTTIRFRRVTFADPDETLLLPATMISLRVTRGSAQPRLRTSVEYTDYRRFLTSGRVIPR